MADVYTPPSRDPADDDHLEGMARVMLDKFLAGVDDMLPARVVSFDRASNRVDVVPLIALLSTNGEQFPRAQINGLPVFMFGGGNHVLTFNLRPGDYGWIKASDRDLSVFLRRYSQSPPSTLRKHSFSDALFFPDAMRGVTMSGEDGAHATLQTLDGQTRVALWDDRVKITQGSKSVTVGPTNINMTNGSASLTMTSTNTTIAGPVVMPDGATIGGIDFGTHKHTGVQSGTSTSGGPTS
jgi:hypothetical protein